MDWWLIGACVALTLVLLKHRIVNLKSYLFPVAYWLYVNTFVGTWMHSKQLARSRDLPPHSRTPPISTSNTYSVEVLPLMDDNFSYFFVDHASGEVAAVDPADATAVMTAFEALRIRWPKEAPAGATAELRLTTVLTTHKHHDHAGGNLELAAMLPDLKVIGGTGEGVAGCTVFVDHEQMFTIGDSTIQALCTPCHTARHMCYFITPSDDKAQSALFTGDTLFVGGVGKFFEGNADQMLHNCNAIFGVLPPDCLVFCGHEYTVDNLEFAVWLEPDNAAVQSRLSWARATRQVEMPTVPSTLREERLCNPFMRAADPLLERAVRDRYGAPAGGSVVAMLREMKDQKMHMALSSEMKVE